MKLTHEERKRLQDACGAAEARTNARLAVVTVPVSDHYHLYPFVYGGITAISVLAVLTLLLPGLPLTAAFVIAAATAAYVMFLLEWMPVRLLCVPRHAKNWECWELAHRAFAARILAQTERKPGIMLFVSFGERYVEVVTDRDVDLRVPQSAWDAIIAEFLSHARQGTVGAALLNAVESCAKVLEQHYPPQ